MAVVINVHQNGRIEKEGRADPQPPVRPFGLFPVWASNGVKFRQYKALLNYIHPSKVSEKNEIKHLGPDSNSKVPLENPFAETRGHTGSEGYPPKRAKPQK
jgi:hypothetical protein